MSDYKVEVVGPAEMEAILARLKRTPFGKSPQRTLVLPGGFELKGEFELVARDASSGEIEWQHKDQNLLTDFGRRRWMFNHFSGAYVAFSPDTRTPSPSRYASTTDTAQCILSGNIIPSNVPATHTKTFIYNPAGTPASNRTLGMIALTDGTAIGSMGLQNIMAYALLTPSRVQTTTQTLEVSYKISMNPIS